MTASGDEEFGKYPAYIAVLIAACVIAVLLNILAIILVMRFGRYTAAVDIFMTNLAVSDIIHAAIVTPIHLKTITSDDFYTDNAVCKVTMFIPMFTIMSAIFTIVAIAIDRYRQIVQKKRLYRQGAILVTVCIWAAAFLFSSPQIYEYNMYVDPPENYTACGSVDIVEHFETYYASFALCFGYAIPLLIIGACYTKVIVCVWDHGRRFRLTRRTSAQANAQAMAQASAQASAKAVEDMRNAQASNRMYNMMSARKIKVLKMLIAITVSFVLLWTPFFILFGLTEITGLDDSTKFLEWPHVASRLMTVLSTITNPLLYVAFSGRFRQAADVPTSTIFRNQPENESDIDSVNQQVEKQQTGPLYS